MKFEIDPNELTTDQRAHVAAFITNWPRDLYGKPPGDAVLKVEPTEEQRLGAEQKEDLFVVEPPHMQAANLDAIFGMPDVAKDILAHAHVEVMMDLNKSLPLDKEGLPWDSRIHSSSKATIADGTWKLRRGVDPAEVEKVKAQLKELMAVPNVHADRVALVNEMVSAGVKLPEHLMGQSTVAIPTPPPAPEIVLPINGPVGIVVPPAPKSHYLIDQEPATVTLTDLIGRMSAAIAAGKLTQANVTEMCVKHGVSEFFLLGNRPDLFPLIDADMKAMGV